MTVYLDDWRQPAHLGPVDDRWSHLIADTEEELHAFAARLGMRRAWFQDRPGDPTTPTTTCPSGPVTDARAHGAVEVTWRELGRMLRDRRSTAARAVRPRRAAPERSGHRPAPSVRPRRARTREDPAMTAAPPVTDLPDPRTPVLVGVGTASRDAEACDLMEEATLAALADAGGSGLGPDVDRVAVPQGSWKYPDPARLVAERIGATRPPPTWLSWGSPSRAW